MQRSVQIYTTSKHDSNANAIISIPTKFKAILEVEAIDVPVAVGDTALEVGLVVVFVSELLPVTEVVVDEEAPPTP
jgi:hypothetical protein